MRGRGEGGDSDLYVRFLSTNLSMIVFIELMNERIDGRMDGWMNGHTGCIGCNE